MTLEILASGIKCNLACTYCYQEPMRRAGNFGAILDADKIIEAIEKSKTDFTLFGGEALLTPIPILERMFVYGFEKFGKNSVQTNGTILTDEHIRMFKKYNVSLGISIDGPEGLNLARCDDTTTRLIITNIERACFHQIPNSLIVTIHKLNAERILKLIDFLSYMERVGVQAINLHNLEVDNEETKQELMLDDELNYLTFKTLYEYSRQSKIPYSPFSDIISLLCHRNPTANCVWTACDPLSTPAVQGIAPDGHLHNCGRTNKDGVDWTKTEDHGKERYLCLSMTPYENGGCRGCKYFFACKGQCPGTAINGDWRNRTKDCLFWYQLIDYIANDLRDRGVQLLDTDEMNYDFLSSIGHADVKHGDIHGDHTDTKAEITNIMEELIKSGHAKRVDIREGTDN
jgi:uncharacterized protein